MINLPKKNQRKEALGQKFYVNYDEDDWWYEWDFFDDF